TVQAAARSVLAIFAAGLLPAALEIADAFTLAADYQRTKSQRLRGCLAYLIIELDGQPASVRSDMRELRRVLAFQKPLNIATGFGASRCEEIWVIRREFSYALRDT